MFKMDVLSNFLITYALITLIVYLASDFLIFPSIKSSYNDNSTQLPPIIKLSTSDGKIISSIFLDNPKAAYTILFSHGNGEDIGVVLPLLEKFKELGFSVFAYDYHGYGTSQGKPSEYTSYLAINAAYRYLTNTLKIPASHIILYGRSIGSGPTLELATQAPVAGIILEAPMVSAFRVMTIVPLFPIDKYRNNQKIQRIQAPILFIHGTQDKVIPLWHGKQLFDLAQSRKRFYAVEGAGHNNVMMVGGEQYFQAIRSFAQGLGRPSGN
jgi:fermentation-respiration switch protein FrsA (DUF1100 family)